MSSSASQWSAEDLARAELILNSFYVASLSLLVYDHILTLGDEIKHMWQYTRLEVGKVLFFLNRYGVPLELCITLYGFFAPTPSTKLCRGLYLFQEISTLISLAIVQVTLLIRTWILWGASRFMLIILSVYLVGCLYATIVILVFNSNGQEFLTSPNVSAGCVVLLPPDPHLWMFWIPVVTFDLVLFALTLIKVVNHRRQHVYGPLVDLLHRDGLIYFALSLGLSIVNMMVFALAPVHYKSVALPVITATLCMTCSRLLLNVRSVGVRPTSTTSSQLSRPSISFELDLIPPSSHTPPHRISSMFVVGAPNPSSTDLMDESQTFSSNSDNELDERTT